MENHDNKMKLIISGIVFLLIIGVVLFSIIFLGKKENKNQNNDNGYKSNTNTNVIKDQTIGNFKFTNTSLSYKDGNSVLRVSVTNSSDKEEKLQEFKIHVYDENKNEIVTLTGFIGDKLASGETKYIESSYADDLTNAYSIEYEIIE